VFEVLYEGDIRLCRFSLNETSGVSLQGGNGIPKRYIAAGLLTVLSANEFQAIESWLLDHGLPIHEMFSRGTSQSVPYSRDWETYGLRHRPPVEDFEGTLAYLIGLLQDAADICTREGSFWPRQERVGDILHEVLRQMNDDLNKYAQYELAFSALAWMVHQGTRYGTEKVGSREMMSLTPEVTKFLSQVLEELQDAFEGCMVQFDARVNTLSKLAVKKRFGSYRELVAHDKNVFT
jgi:hypothetical protein